MVAIGESKLIIEALQRSRFLADCHLRSWCKLEVAGESAREQLRPRWLRRLQMTPRARRPSHLGSSPPLCYTYRLSIREFSTLSGREVERHAYCVERDFRQIKMPPGR